MKIRLTVGRYDSVEEFDVDDFEVDLDYIAERLYKLSLQHLRSRDVEVEWNPDTKTGKVFAGFHCVGHAEVVK